METTGHSVDSKTAVYDRIRRQNYMKIRLGDTYIVIVVRAWSNIYSVPALRSAYCIMDVVMLRNTSPGMNDKDLAIVFKLARDPMRDVPYYCGFGNTFL